MDIIDNNKLRFWVNPIVCGSFILSASTGVMLFFKISPGLVKPAHEWLSWILVAAAIFHAMINWRAILRFLSKPIGQIILTIFIFMLGASMLPVSVGKQKGHPYFRIGDQLAKAPLSAVATTANRAPEEVITILRSNGIQVDDVKQTVQDIARRNNQSSVKLLDMIFR